MKTRNDPGRSPAPPLVRMLLRATMAVAAVAFAFSGSVAVLHAEPSVDASLDADLGGSIGLDLSGVAGTVDGTLGVTGDDLTGDAVESAEVCMPSCGDGNDALVDGNVAGGRLIDDAGAEICVLGDCDAGTVAGNGLLIAGASTEDGDTLGDTSAAACVLADCSQGDETWSAVAAGTVGATPALMPALGATDAAADFCIIGTCRTSQAIESPSNGGGGTSVDAGVCLLADCGIGGGAADDGATGPAGNGGPEIDGIVIPDPIPQGPDGPEVLPPSDVPGTADGPGTPSGQPVPGLPDTGFAPLVGTGVTGWAYLTLAFGTLAAAWYAGVRLIWRQG